MASKPLRPHVSSTLTVIRTGPPDLVCVRHVLSHSRVWGEVFRRRTGSLVSLRTFFRDGPRANGRPLTLPVPAGSGSELMAGVVAALLPRSCQRVPVVAGWLAPSLLQAVPGCRLTPRPRRAVHRVPPLCAGHNKWSKVKNVKGPKDAVRSQMFLKLTLMIRVAVREGGSNPEFNPQLASLVEQCRTKNMPKATIEAAIKGAEKQKAGTSQIYEARGPGGSVLLVEVLTDNNARTHQQLKYLIQKHGGSICDGARHSFARKGVVVAAGEGVSAERALELAIEAGAEDVRETEDEEEKPLLQFVCEPSSLRSVRAALESLGLSTQSAALEFVSCNHAVLPLEQLEAASLLLTALNEHPDVVRVWDNIQAQD
ncbi:translational activator of cytochrome c oxidase 1 [Arapaima gigas]